VPYQLSRLAVSPLLRLYGRPRLLGGANVPASGPAILASNHLSVIDSVYLPLLLGRPVTFPAKAEYFAARGPAGRAWSAYLRSTGQLTIDRDDPRAAQATLEAALALLRDGQLLGFYPEGTRSPDGRLYRGRSGIGYLALRSGVPVIPVAMTGTRQMLPPGARIPRPHPVRVIIGEPVAFDDVSGLPPARARSVIADQVTAAIARLSGQEYVHMYASVRKAQIAMGAGVNLGGGDDGGHQ
jgi:1-acyl-sn-glycerol-3-phosphate acyltransferase